MRPSKPSVVVLLTEQGQPEGLPLPPLAKAERTLVETVAHQGGAAGALFALFGVALAEQSDLPVAALTALVDLPGEMADGWLRADPISLQPSGGGLLLAAAETIELTMAEATALGEVTRAFLAEEGLALQTPGLGRWYLRLSAPWQVQTTPLADGAMVGSTLPTGLGAQPWLQRMNELQMLLHDHPVNQAREAQDRYPLNSLWFWGGGALPKPPEQRWQQVVSNDPLARGLALHSGSEWLSPPADLEGWLARLPVGASLLMPDSREPERIDHTLVQLQDALRAGQISSLEVWLSAPTQRERLRWEARAVKPWWRFW